MISLVICSTGISQDRIWDKITNGPYGETVQSITIDHEGTIFCGTDESVQRSTNGGTDWEVSVSGIESPCINSIIALDDGTILAGTTPDGVYRSTDGGSTWIPSNDGIDTTLYLNIFTLAVRDDGRVYACSNNCHDSDDNGVTWRLLEALDPFRSAPVIGLAVTPERHLFACTVYGIYRSTDEGSSWETVNSTCFVGTVVVNRAGYLFAGVNGSKKPVFRSTDNGETWELANGGLPSSNLWTLHPFSADTILAGTWGSGVFKTTDNGDSWFDSDDGLDQPYVRVLGGESTGRLFAGTGTGIFHSDDGGGTWSLPETGLSETRVWSIIGTDEGTILSGTFSGAFISSNNGKSWARTSIPNIVVRCLTVTTEGYLFAGTYAGEPFRSTDAGVTWTQSSLGYDACDVAELALDSTGFVYAASFGSVYRSSDNGDSWVLADPGFGSNYQALYVSRDQRLYAASSWGLSVSTDRGDTWTRINTQVGPHMQCLAENSSGLLFTGTTGTGVYRSSDGGFTWEHASGGIEDEDVEVIAVDAGDRLYAATSSGVFRSTDGGDSWEEFSLGLTADEMSSLFIQDDGLLLAASWAWSGGGVFRSRESTLVTSVADRTDAPDSHSLSQNYPNPFNPITTISFSIPQSSLTNLTVFDLLGREVATVVNERLSPGTYQKQWDATGYPSGVYFYRLRAGESVQTRKLILLK